MNIMIFDTETTSLEKPFCYNVGYTIIDTDELTVINAKEYICEQVWHNPMLFATAYYSNKREFYIKSMRSRKATLKKFGYICQDMIRDIKQYNITMAFAYNSAFDEKVFNFNCEWFKCNNPFDNVEIKDIRGFAHHFLIDDNYINWCERYKKFTESNNYSTTAETMYQFIYDNPDFAESHTALDDSMIETEILLATLSMGANLNENYKAMRTIPRKTHKVFKVISEDETFEFNCFGYTFYRSKDTVKLRQATISFFRNNIRRITSKLIIVKKLTFKK